MDCDWISKKYVCTYIFNKSNEEIVSWFYQIRTTLEFSLQSYSVHQFQSLFITFYLYINTSIHMYLTLSNKCWPYYKAFYLNSFDFRKCLCNFANSHCSLLTYLSQVVMLFVYTTGCLHTIGDQITVITTTRCQWYIRPLLGHLKPTTVYVCMYNFQQPKETIQAFTGVTLWGKWIFCA